MFDFIAKQKKHISLVLEELFASQVKNNTFDPAFERQVFDRLYHYTINGKMIRGGLVAFACRLFKTELSQTVTEVGAALELFQSAFLVHDDIMDNDLYRRGQPALHHQYQLAGKKQGFADPGHYGQAMAVCAGDIAFFSAFQIISAIKMPCQLHREIMRLFVREFIQVGIAQMKEVQLSRLKERVQEEDIFEVYTYKTSRYTFSLPLMLGAMAADQERVILEQFSRLGEYIGLIFQIRDDELGLFGESRETGKPVGSDIREAKQTIYYCKLFKKAQPEEKIRLQQIFGKPDLGRQEIDYVLGLTSSLGVREEVNLIVAGLQRKSAELLGQMTFLTPWGRQMFEQLFEYNLNREK